MKKTMLVTLCVLFSATNSFANFPRNNLHLQDRVNKIASIDEKMFNDIIDTVTKLFGPVVASHGGNLVIEKNWNDSTVNAYASQNGKNWVVSMFGGLARRPEVTPDGFAMVVCHELGHHLGGYAFYGEGNWASSEGNADYFATEACAPIVFAQSYQLGRNHQARAFASPTAIKGCDAAWSDQPSRERCYRTANAGQSLANLLAALEGAKAPSFDTPDMSQVAKTNPDHPHAQCRLDTYFNGALCTKKFDFKTIPGRNNPKGQVSAEAEMEAAKSTCMQTENPKFAFRPRCWFKPIVGSADVWHHDMAELN